MVKHAAAPLISVSTSEAPEDPFGYFRSALTDVYRGIAPRRTGSSPFRADVLAYAVGEDVVFSRMRATGHAADRGPRGVSADGDDSVFLNLAADAPSRLDHLGRRTVLRPGQPVLIDNSRPFELALSDARRFSLYSLRLPRRLGGRTLTAQDVADANELLADARQGRLAALLLLLRREFDAGRIPVWEALVPAVRAMLEDMIRPGARADTASSVPAFDAITAVAIDHLDDPGFGLTQAAGVLGRSPRAVQAAFAEAGTTWSQWSLAARLDSACERIASPAWAGRSLVAIARSSGLGDPSYFHRTFRARFGAPPGAFRPAGAAPVEPIRVEPAGRDLSRADDSG